MTVSPALSTFRASVTADAFDVPTSEGAMRKSADKGRGCAGFDPQGCVAFLRRRHPAPKTAAAVAEATRGRVPARTVERWLAGDAGPSLKAFGWLAVAYGPAVVAATLPGLDWVERALALAEHEAMAAEIAALQRRQARLAATMVRDDARGDA